MVLKGWMLAGAVVLLGGVVGPTASPAFQLNSEDRRVGPDDVSATPLSSSLSEDAFEGGGGDPGLNFQQAQSSWRSPAAGAPPLRLSPDEFPQSRIIISSEEISREPIPTENPVAFDAPSVAAVPSFSPGSLTSGGASITGVRLGQHPDKTRVVVDMSEKADFSYGVRESGTSVVISFSGVDLQADLSSQGSRGLVSGYSFARSVEGVDVFDIETTVPVRLKNVFALPPQGEKGHRIVLDLTGAQGMN